MSYREFPDDQETGSLWHYLNIALRRWKVVVAIFLLVFAGAAAYTYTRQPIYQAHATLQVNRPDETQGVLGKLGEERRDPTAAIIQVIRSRSLAEQAVRRLNLNWQALDESSGARYTIREFQVPAGVSRLVIEFEGDGRYRVLDGGGQVIATGQSGQPLQAGELSLLIEIEHASAGQRVAFERLPLTEMAEKVRQSVDAWDKGGGTNVLQLAVTSPDPVWARDVVNALARAYLDYSVTLKTRESKQALEFVDRQVEKLQTALEKSERSLQEYRIETGVTLGSDSQEAVDDLVALERQRGEIGLQRERLKEAISSLEAAMTTGEEFIPPSLAGMPEGGAATAGQLAQLEGEKKAMLVEFTEAHPAVVDLQRRIQKTQYQLLGTYQAALKSLETRSQDLGRLIAKREQGLSGIPAAELELMRRARHSKVNEDLYTYLLQRQQESRIAQASTTSNVEVLDLAVVPQKPISPNTRKNLLMGLFGGLFLGIGAAFLLNQLDDTLKDTDEIKRMFGVPVLGVVPHIPLAKGGAAERLVAMDDPRSGVAEAFRSLRTNLHFTAVDSPSKVVLITSSFPDEGKTTVSSNLAVTLAQTGARVLLVGCDLRRPSLHEVFGVANSPGLTELLAGKESSVLKKVEQPRLDFITAGAIPPNPSELLGSNRMQEILEGLRQRYDFIVIDAPPMLPVTDAQILTSLSDLVLLVMEPSRVPRKAAHRLLEIFETARAPLKGIVLNDKSGKAMRSYGYYGHKYYGSYYSYYGEDPKKSARARS